MRLFPVLASLAVILLPAAGRGADVTPLYPDSAVLAFGVDIKGITTSPLGRKAVGADKPFDATRKLLKVLLPEGVLPVTEKTLRPLESVANRLERATVAGSIEGGGRPTLAIFLEGEVGAEDYAKTAEAFAKAEKMPFETVKLGERRLLVLGNADAPVYGTQVGKSLFVLATQRELIDEVLDKHAGKRKAKMQPALAEWLKKAKPAETPMWLAVGELKVLEGIKGGVATIVMKDDAEFRIEVACGKEELAATVKSLFDWAVDYLAKEKTPQAEVWTAAKIVVKRDGTTVTATGKIPGKLLAEEYAKQK
jgi:hypothetical protein